MRFPAPVAQWIEQRPSKPFVGGSTPLRGAKYDLTFSEEGI